MLLPLVPAVAPPVLPALVLPPLALPPLAPGEGTDGLAPVRVAFAKTNPVAPDVPVAPGVVAEVCALLCRQPWNIN